MRCLYFIFWNAMPCNLVHTYQYFGGSWVSRNDGSKKFCSVLNYWNSLHYSLLHYNSSVAIGTFSYQMHSLLLWQAKLMIIANRFAVNSTHVQCLFGKPASGESGLGFRTVCSSSAVSVIRSLFGREGQFCACSRQGRGLQFTER